MERSDDVGVAMIGAGGWGTAMVSQLAQKYADVILYSRNKKVLSDIAEIHENPDYLRGVHIPEHVRLTSDLEEAACADTVILATPSLAISETAEAIAPFLKQGALVISTAKGLSREGERLSTVIAEKVASKTARIAVLSGPNHAEEVGKGQPAASVVAAATREVALAAQDVYMLPHFRVYFSTDLAGVEYGGALKNIIALAAGVTDGLQYGDNTRSALITRGLTEVVRFAKHYGAHSSTLFGLSGMGDLIVTCTSVHSRNHAAGYAIGQGKPLDEVLGSTNKVVEGVRTTRIVYPLAKRFGIEMPIMEQVYQVLEGKTNPKDALRVLMNREKKEEVQEPVFEGVFSR